MSADIGEEPTQAAAMDSSSPAGVEEGELHGEEEEDAEATQALVDTSSAAPAEDVEEDDDQPTQLLGNSALTGEESEDGDRGEEPTQALASSAVAEEEDDGDGDATQRLNSNGGASESDMETQATGATEGYDPEDVHDSQSQIQTQVKSFFPQGC